MNTVPPQHRRVPQQRSAAGTGRQQVSHSLRNGEIKRRPARRTRRRCIMYTRREQNDVSARRPPTIVRSVRAGRPANSDSCIALSKGDRALDQPGKRAHEPARLNTVCKSSGVHRAEVYTAGAAPRAAVHADTRRGGPRAAEVFHCCTQARE